MNNLADRLFRFYPAVLLLALAALTFWLDRKVQPPPVPRDGSTRHDPDFEIDGFSATRMNPDGSQRYAIQGSSMVHYPDDGTTELADPRFVHFDARTAPVRVRSRRAQISRDGDVAEFFGEVRIVREAWERNPEMTLDTEYLELQPDADLARTDAPLVMTQGASRVTATGMRFDNRRRVLELQKDVKVTYATPIALPTFERARGR
ncbi:MAG: LPS export ABC transporter periplasmic protein LptC [Burkholderiales bacterium]|nr:LPS export ABC transporter periplasmic protein LptC [Burkholderiales bacterium]